MSRFFRIAVALGFLVAAIPLTADWKLLRSDPSVRWSPVISAPAAESESEPELLSPGNPPDPLQVPPIESTPQPAEVTPPEPPPEVLFPTPEPPRLEVLEEGWQPDWFVDSIEENSFLWRDSGDNLGIVPDGNNGFGLTTLSFESVWKNSNAGGFWVVPRFTWTFASGPDEPNVRAQLYDLRLEMNLAHPLNDTWTVHLHAAPAFVGDWNNKSSDAFRLIGGGMLAGHLNPQWTVLGGVTALSRFDMPILPVGGVRWHPNSRVEVDAVYPNPRLSWCYDQNAEKHETHWLYLGGQLTGNQWAVDLAHDQHDKLGYRDYRVVIGWESREANGENSFFELGYVMQRRLKFDRFGPDRTPNETLVFRWGSRF